MGDNGYPEPRTKPSGPGPASEGGRIWDTGGRKKKTLKVLERWPPALESSPGGLSNKKKQVKRLQRTATGRDNKEGGSKVEGRKQELMEKWLKGGKGPGNIPKDSLRKDPDIRNLEPSEEEERKPKS